jgi:hypothetical protein
MKPRETRAYCLGVGHVAAGTLPLGSGAEVLAALSRRRRDVLGNGVGDGEATTMAVAMPRFHPGDLVSRRSNNGQRTQNLCFDSLIYTVYSVDGSVLFIGSRDKSKPLGWVDAEDFVLVRRAAPEPQR